MMSDTLPALNNQQSTRAIKLKASGLGQLAGDQLGLPSSGNDREVI